MFVTEMQRCFHVSFQPDLSQLDANEHSDSQMMDDNSVITAHLSQT